MRLSLAAADTASKVAFIPMVRPNKVKAIITDSSVSTARVGLRMIAAQTSGMYFTPPPSRAHRGTRHQGALVHCQLTAGMVGRLGIVRDHHDRLIVLAVELLQQPQDL